MDLLAQCSDVRGLDAGSIALLSLQACDATLPAARAPLGEARITTARLEAVAALHRSGQIRRSFEAGRYSAWFPHRLFGLELKIVEGVLDLPMPSLATGRADAVRRFMDLSGANVARLTMTGAPIQGAPSAQGLLQAGTAVESRDLLLLEGDPEIFLSRLGRHTRRNVRRADRIAGETGMVFRYREGSRAAAIEDIRALAARNKPAPLTLKRLAAHETLIAGKKSGFESQLALATGEVISYCRGFIEGNVAFLVYQANDPTVPRINLSLLHRFKLIEQLIGQGVRELMFPFGCAGLLRDACVPVQIEERIVIRTSVAGIATALTLSAALAWTRIGALVWRTLSTGIACKIAPARDDRRLPPVLSG
jgi:hypothetical protein